MASISVNLSVTSAGAQPTAPATLYANLITLVAANNPDYTILPNGLIEDLASTATYALALIDSAAVELINSMTPFSANPWLLVQLGNIYGIPQGLTSNTSVYVVFSGTVGFNIPAGFVVSDGTYQYVVQQGVTIGSGGSSSPAYCVATQSGSWAVPAGSVTNISSSVPTGYTLTVTNPQAGTPSAGAETQAQYASAVLGAGLVTGQGTAQFLKALLGEVPGVQSNLISIRQQTAGWEVIVGGGDPYAVATAILQSGLDLTTLVGSTIKVASATQANPCVITTNLLHGFASGASATIAGATGMTAINGTWTVTVTGPYTFSIAVDTSAAPAYTGNGVVTPNSRNISVDIESYPDSYTVPFVNPPAQPVVVQVTWNTTSPNFVSTSAVQQLAAPAIAAYISSIPVSAPINVQVLNQTFVAATASLFGNNAALVSELVWTISINGVDVSPSGSTFLIQSDAEGYYTCSASNVTATQA